MRFHVLGIPHTITTPEYSTCAFTQKVVTLCQMLMMEGHEVIHYGHEDSDVACVEHVAVTDRSDLATSYPNHDWRKQGFPSFAKSDPVYKTFYRNANHAIDKRKRTGDFLLCPFGDWHRPVAEAHSELIAVESGIGYPNGAFAKYRVYESYAIMHAYQGNSAAQHSSNDFWYDAVIPNAFKKEDFTFVGKVHETAPLLFLGRVNEGKGIHIARDLAERTQTPLIVAGPGICEQSEWVRHVGVVGPDQRRALLSEARAVICASTFLEPFCGVQIEAMLSGTPVISTDRGAFAEYNKHGETGYRCRTMEHFEWAVRNIENIDRYACRQHALNFTLERVAPRYTEYFQSVKDIYGGKGFYEPRPERQSLAFASV